MGITVCLNLCIMIVKKYLYFLTIIIHKLRQTVISWLPKPYFKKVLNILTNKHLLVVTSNVMPGNAIIIDIIEHSYTSFCRTIDLFFCIIWLWNVLSSKL